MSTDINPERVSRLEGQISGIYRTQNDHSVALGVHEQRHETTEKAIGSLAGEVAKLRSALVTAALSFAGGSGLVAFTIYQAFGR